MNNHKIKFLKILKRVSFFFSLFPLLTYASASLNEDLRPLMNKHEVQRLKNLTYKKFSLTIESSGFILEDPEKKIQDSNKQSESPKAGIMNCLYDYFYSDKPKPILQNYQNLMENGISFSDEDLEVSLKVMAQQKDFDKIRWDIYKHAFSNMNAAYLGAFLIEKNIGGGSGRIYIFLCGL